MTDESDTAIRIPVLRDLTFREIHAFQNGLYSGVVEGSRPTDYRSGKEQHYWRMGFLAGMMGRNVMVVLAGVGLGRLLAE